MLPQPRSNKPGRLVWLTIAMTATVGGLAWAWHVREPGLLAERYAEQLPDVPAGEVEAHLRRIAELGDAGLPVLAAALASDRPQVRDWARLLLLDEVNHWELLSAPAATAKLGRLAKVLARVMPEMEPTNRKFAADLALRALDWPHDEGSERGQLLADCDAVLKAAGPRFMNAARPATGPGLTARTEVSIGGGSLASATLPAEELGRMAALPGGGLPVEPAAMPRFDGFIEPQIAAKNPAGGPAEPHHLPDRLGGRPLQDNALPRDSLSDSLNSGSPAAPGVNQPRRLPSIASNESNMRHLTVDVQGETPTPGDLAAWHRLKPRDVMRQLHVTDPRVVAAARIELEHRGVTGSQVEVARLATDPDPQVRKALAESLPSLPGIDAKPWLLELSYDEDAQVRATAVTLMATSGDLELLKRIEQISREDSDDYTRAQAMKALPPRARTRE